MAEFHNILPWIVTLIKEKNPKIKHSDINQDTNSRLALIGPCLVKKEKNVSLNFLHISKNQVFKIKELWLDCIFIEYSWKYEQNILPNVKNIH